jgi:NADH-quinone oxidoreductase subunit E
MLTAEERAAILEEVREHLTPISAGVSALKVIQASRRWVSDEHLREAAEILGVTPVELEEVATFYNLIYRRQVGEHVIHVCDSITCWMLGSESITAHLQRRLGARMGQTTADGKFTLLPVVCLGNCDHAPTLVIDGELYNDVTEERLDEILAGLGWEGGS